MKKFLEQSLAFVASAGFVATAGLVYTTTKNVNLERELRKDEMVIKNRELDLKESQLELEKYKHNLPSKFETTPILDNKIKTPVSDVLNNKLESSKVVQELPNIKETFNTDSPFEGLNNKLESSKTVQELSNIKDTFNTDSPFEGWVIMSFIEDTEDLPTEDLLTEDLPTEDQGPYNPFTLAANAQSFTLDLDEFHKFITEREIALMQLPLPLEIKEEFILPALYDLEEEDLAVMVKKALRNNSVLDPKFSEYRDIRMEKIYLPFLGSVAVVLTGLLMQWFIDTL
ncbi:hypothetical protein ABG067_007662 [Albugo candida]